MDGPRDYHTKWNKSGRERYHMASLICGILTKIIWTFKKNLQNRNRLTNIEKRLVFVEGEEDGGGKDWVWD